MVGFQAVDIYHAFRWIDEGVAAGLPASEILLGVVFIFGIGWVIDQIS